MAKAKETTTIPTTCEIEEKLCYFLFGNYCYSFTLVCANWTSALTNFHPPGQDLVHTKFSTSSKGVCVWYKTNRLDIQQRKKQKAWSQLSKTTLAMLSIDISNSESGNCIELKLPLENKLLLLWKETFLAHTIGFTASTWTNWVWNFFRISDISECMRWSFESSARVVSILLWVCVASYHTDIIDWKKFCFVAVVVYVVCAAIICSSTVSFPMEIRLYHPLRLIDAWMPLPT